MAGSQREPWADRVAGGSQREPHAPALQYVLSPCSSEDYPEIERLFPEAEIQYIPGAGHWVHADKSQEFITAICNFLLLP